MGKEISAGMAGLFVAVAMTATSWVGVSLALRTGRGVLVGLGNPLDVGVIMLALEAGKGA